MARAEHFLSEFAGMADLNGFRSILEIGCADGFLLRKMKSTFALPEDLVGIEPSLPESIQSDGISLLKGFANAEMELDRRFDLIFSAGVFEHIEKIGEVMTFCDRHLEENGNLFFCVPDAEGQLLSGDPALFTHQHAHCFMEDSVGRLLAHHGFELSRLIKIRDSLKVLARKSRRAAQYPFSRRRSRERTPNGLIPRWRQKSKVAWGQGWSAQHQIVAPQTYGASIPANSTAMA